MKWLDKKEHFRWMNRKKYNKDVKVEKVFINCDEDLLVELGIAEEKIEELKKEIKQLKDKYENNTFSGISKQINDSISFDNTGTSEWVSQPAYFRSGAALTVETISDAYNRLLSNTIRAGSRTRIGND